MAKADRKDRKAAKKAKQHGRRAWKTVDSATAVAALLVAPKVSNVAWRVLTGRRAPGSARHPQLPTSEAIAYAAASGAVVSVVRTMLRRGVADYWVRATGELPPGVKPLKSPEQ